MLGKFYEIFHSLTAPTCTHTPNAIAEENGKHCYHLDLVSLSQICWAEYIQKLNLNATKGRKG